MDRVRVPAVHRPGPGPTGAGPGRGTTPGAGGNAATARLLRGRSACGPRAVPPIVTQAPTPGTTAAPEVQDWRRLVHGITAVSGLGGVDAARALSGDASQRDGPPGGEGVHATAARIDRSWGLLGAGSPVPDDVRDPYERSFGVDLSAARMHVGTPAARAVTGGFGVEALTLDDHMLFARAPAPHVLGHELAHVTQHGLRGPAPANASLRAARPGSDVERDADAASLAARDGRTYTPRAAGGEDVSMLAPLAILAIAALVAGVGVAVTAEVVGPSYEENARRREERSRDPSFAAWAEAGWLWVPVGGTATRIWQAESRFERYFNVAMMPLDVLTLGALGSAAAKVGSTGLWRTAVTRAAPEELAALGRAGVAVTTKAEVQLQARAALEAGQAVVATVGRRNHALVYVMVDGQLYRLTGGAMRSMAVRTMESFAPRSINAFHALGNTASSARILAEARMLSRGWGLGFSLRSCGLSTARLAESGLLSLGERGLGLAGGRAYLPVTVMGALAERGGVTMSQQGARWMLMGSGMQLALLGTARSTATLVTSPQAQMGLAGLMVDGYGLMRGVYESLLGDAAQDLVPAPSSTPDMPGLDPVAQMEATASDLDAALETTEPGDDGIAMTEVPGAFLALQNRLALASEGEVDASQPLVLEPHFTFLATLDDTSAEPPVDMSQVLDLRSLVDTDAAAGSHLDHEWLVELSGTPEYAEPALRFADDLGRAVHQEDHDRILDTVPSYFTMATPRPQERAAAAATALQRAGLADDDLARARTLLGSSY